CSAIGSRGDITGDTGWGSVAEPHRYHRRTGGAFLLPETCVRQQLDRSRHSRSHWNPCRYWAGTVERAFSRPWIPWVRLLAEGDRHRRTLPIALGGVPVLSPGSGDGCVHGNDPGDRDRHGA